MLSVRPIKVQKFMQAMRQLGFEQKSKMGSHVLLRHAKTGLVVSVPTSYPDVPPVVVRGIGRQIENFRVTTEDEFFRLLKK